jgi:acyl-CoA synthetase (AMP-forming)/AMP-acid ligase II
MHLNRTSMLRASTLIDLLCERSQQLGDLVQYVFLHDGGEDALEMTVGELDQRARAIAVALGEVARADDRALLLYPPGLDYVTAFFGCLYAGVIAVPAYPPEPARLARTLPRLTAIVQSSRARWVLTTSAIKSMSSAIVGEAPALAEPGWIATDDVSASAASAWRAPDRGPESTAFLQFTSGSTTSPRGVVLSHGAVMNNLRDLALALDIRDADCMVSWLPPYHDMGLTGGILSPLYCGMKDVLMSPARFLKRPVHWLRAISEYRATISGGPNFAFDLCVRKVAPEVEGLDLSCWRLAPVGAEVVQHATLQAFSRKFAALGFRRTAFFPCYGLAECTLFATGGRAGAGPAVAFVDARGLEAGRAAEVAENEPGARALVSCGRATSGAVVIVDPESRRALCDGQVGEIWLRSGSMGDGYWGLTEETVAVFEARIADASDARYLRTGDLGFLDRGELFVTGRRKDVIVVRGRNLYPEDLEKIAAAAHPALRPGCAAAFAVDFGGSEQVALALEVEEGAEHFAAISSAVVSATRAAFDVVPHEVLLLAPGTLPKTSSGKIQRSTCRSALAEGALTLLHR